MKREVVSQLAENFVESFRPRASCPICADGARTEYFNRAMRGVPLRFSKCVGCGLIYQDPMPAPEALRAYFSSNEFINDGHNTDDLRETLGYYNYSAWDYSYRRTASVRLSVVRRWVPPPAKLLEIGTATGSFLDEARRRGYATQGLDISERLAKSASALYDLNIENGFIEEHPLPAAGFDLICAFGGIACWWDPLRALSRIRQSLKPGGAFMFNFSDVSNPLAQMAGPEYPEFNHASLVIYSRKTMGDLLKRAGFRVVYDRTERQYASLERIVTYWRSNLLWRVTETLGISQWMWKIPAIGTRLVVCQPI